MQLVKIHSDKLSGQLRASIRDQCCSMLNNEWPRSETLRLRSLDSSCDDLPMCLALISDDDDDATTVMGHVRLGSIMGEPNSVWLESLVIHPDLRGSGMGKYFMLLTEEFCKLELHRDTVYLCTGDKQPFYSRCGYTFCPPVTAYSGNVKLCCLDNLKQNQPEPVKSVVSKKTEPTIKSNPAPPPPPPPPCQKSPCKVPLEKGDEDDIAVLCAKLFIKSPKMPEKPPQVPKTLRKLEPKPFTGKEQICKDVMKKKLL